MSGEGKYDVRSTKEASRINAVKVAEEIPNDLKQKRFVDGVPRKQRFQHYPEILIARQKRKVARNEKAKRFSTDDEDKLNRKDDGILEYFGKMDVASITTSKMEQYLNFLDDRREKPLVATTKNKHIYVVRKVLKCAYEDEVIQHLPISPSFQ